ncbi:hypothetical protein LAUMK4_05378 [Mycobacterium persicum]|uniref:Uncharacterized protein n=1 Tax=Mycobacterium persicum TaxID=1487726 RepID=A0AB38V133_9MYCO|nr:hypothetical protein LAUMK15_00108 [Mycobacterium persicum]VAZ86516.1 hypothetical protein LAUMK42_05365 [Mycobacterium persicum]VBA31129.1 hypothetical protein LAUMK4_05378 [Mycobacterium persicum]
MSSEAGPAVPTAPPVGGLPLRKLACQAGIVISFYDLSRSVPGHRSALHGRITGLIIPLDGQPIDKTGGVNARNVTAWRRRSCW